MQNSWASLRSARFLILGGNGQLGSEFATQLSRENIRFDAFDINDFDISDKDELYECIKSSTPDFIINCAAYNFVDKAESEKELALKSNAYAPAYIAEIASDLNIKPIHFSTDYVFDGKIGSRPFSETDSPNPINIYGETKLLGETNFMQFGDTNLLFRLSWVWGGGKQNFIYKLLSWVKSKQQLHITDDEVSVPTSVRFIVYNVGKSISQGMNGLYHLVPSGACSRYEWASEIKALNSLSVILERAKRDDFQLPAKRPEFSALSNSKFAIDSNSEPIDWLQDLRGNISLVSDFLSFDN